MSDLISVSPITALRELEPLIVEHAGVPYTVVQTKGAIRAYINLCPHEDKVFKPQVNDRCLVCPFHNVSFDAESGKVRDSNGRKVPGGLPRVETLIRDGWIHLIVDDSHNLLLAIAAGRRQERKARKQRRRGWLALFGLGGRTR